MTLLSMTYDYMLLKWHGDIKTQMIILADFVVLSSQLDIIT